MKYQDNKWLIPTWMGMNSALKPSSLSLPLVLYLFLLFFASSCHCHPMQQQVRFSIKDLSCPSVMFSFPCSIWLIGKAPALVPADITTTDAITLFIHPQLCSMILNKQAEQKNPHQNWVKAPFRYQRALFLSNIELCGRGSTNTILPGTQSEVVGEGTVLLEKYPERPYPSAVQHWIGELPWHASDRCCISRVWFPKRQKSFPKA